MGEDRSVERRELRELAVVFLRLGTIAFGGPAGHIAMMRQEVVERRGWLTEQELLDLIGAANLIPGPNSTEVAIHVGRRRAGWRGLLVAGACFIVPAFLIVLALAALYVETASTPEARWLLYGVLPIVIAIIAQAIFGLGRTAVKGVLTGVIGVAAFALYLLGINEIVLLVGGGLVALLARLVRRGGGPGAALLSMLALLGVPAPAFAYAAAGATGSVSLAGLFWSMLKIGALLYGGGYVLIAFLQSELVERLGVLTSTQLLDAVAIGQVTPGPLFTTATFVGYLVAGVPGALVSTVAIFLPAFVFVALTAPLLPRMRRSAAFSAFLDGVNVAALGLMAAVTAEIADDALVDPLTVALAIAALVALLVWRLGSGWLVLAGAAVGIVSHLL